jgi:5'(3')-deoxyribonucleotidase
MKKLTESTFLVFAMTNYDNPQCSDISEFEEDLKRFQYLRKLFGRYRQDGDLKERLILNHLIIIYNVFVLSATNMLFMKLHEYHEFLKPFVEYLNFMPELICYDENTINKDSIDSDKGITDILKGI